MLFARTLILIAGFASLATAQNIPNFRLDVAVADSAGHPVNGVLVHLTDDQKHQRSGETDEIGHLLFTNLRPGRYDLTAEKAGFLPLAQQGIEVRDRFTSIELVLPALLPRTENIEVRGTIMAVEESASVVNKLPPGTARELPSRPSTVADALPLTPGVVREPGGGLILSSSPEHRSALIVNSADVTDPATGQFGLTVPIDSVEVLSVYQTAYLAEYGRFTAGLVSVETKRGGDKWKWEINDPLPEFRIRSYHLRGLKTATPRLNFEGPLIANKLFFSEGFEYAVRKTAVYTLPFPYNQKRQQGLNSFSQLDWIASAKHLVTATVHLAPQRIGALTMDFYNPLPSTPDSRARNFTGTVFDRLTIWRGLLENRFSVTSFDTATWSRGNDDFVMSPTGNSGSFFANQERNSRRTSGASSFSFAPIEKLGTHQFKIGGYLAGSEQTGDRSSHPVNVVDMLNRRLLRITFSPPRNFQVSDIEKSFFAQDHWILTNRFSLDFGVRTESQQISGAFRVAPRGGFSFVPVPEWQTTFRGGFGFFYDRVPLNVYAFNRYPNRIITLYDTTGAITSGPTLYVNTLGQSRVRFPFVRQQPKDGNFSPRGNIWSFQVEQPIGKRLKARATYLHNDGDGLVILNRVAPDPDNDTGAFLLEGTGESRYRQLDFTALLKLRDDRQLHFSYTYSQARGDINDFGRFIGTVPAPIIRANQYGRLPTDLPNRFLTWGVVRFPLKFQIAPVVEYRTGFPYLETNATQGYAGTPYRNRFPNFFSIDSRFSKDLKVTTNYSVRLSLSGFNLTNHFNPEAVRGNSADPAYGYFFGHRGRRFTVDFDFLF